MRLIPGAIRRQGRRLLNQQCWNWGRDVVRPDGNLLLEAGFATQRPPEGETGATRYVRQSPGGGCLILWGFGLFYGTAKTGGVYLNRFKFEPRWLPLAAVEPPIWRADRVPVGQPPPEHSIPAGLVAEAARRIADYEERTLACCGLEYRCRVLSEWREARERIAPQLLPHAWRELAERLDAVQKSGWE